MTRPEPPVYLEGEGAILPDGRFIPQPAIDRAVDLIARCCAAVTAAEAAVVAEAEAVTGGGV